MIRPATSGGTLSGLPSLLPWARLIASASVPARSYTRPSADRNPAPSRSASLNTRQRRNTPPREPVLIGREAMRALNRRRRPMSGKTILGRTERSPSVRMTPQCVSGSVRWVVYGRPVPRPDFSRTIMDFQERFAIEAACLEYLLAASWWPEGFRCPGCEGRDAWVLERRHLWECASCHRQTSVTAGTVMHRTRTPLRLWFWAAYLLATHHPGISAKQLQRQLGIR